MHSSSGPTNSAVPSSITPFALRSRLVSITPFELRSTQSSSSFAYFVTVPWLPNARLETYASKFWSTAVREGQLPVLLELQPSFHGRVPPGTAAPTEG